MPVGDDAGWLQTSLPAAEVAEGKSQKAQSVSFLTEPKPAALPLEKDQSLPFAKPNQANGSATTQSVAIGKKAAPA